MSLKEHFKSQFKKDLRQYGKLGGYLKLTIKYGWVFALVISIILAEIAFLNETDKLGILSLSLFKNYNFIDILQLLSFFGLLWIFISGAIYCLVFFITIWLPHKFMVPMDADGRYQFEKTKCPKCYKQVMTITQLNPPSHHYHAYCESCHHQFNFML